LSWRPSFPTKTFFSYEDLRAGIDAPVIVDVTIIAVSTEKGFFVGSAHINKLIKGSISGDAIKILTIRSSCGPFGIGVGANGLVGGILRYDFDGVPALLALVESRSERAKRRAYFRSKSNRWQHQERDLD
jgi:hypothetical protein